ncbi:hypothetical protein CFOL_v3_30723 [Cephalotus follicularis]|uniref:Protein FAR1-RELATED SEQUENCE n=1 Tax=Cephalotus follicularis TaxID=3775 RepID=A0A1Q3D464_CEPFO|nr:hypothetical protein CFOL_v3_30723 [Cephalotus follicularis]
MESENCSSSKVNTPSGSQDKDILKPEVGMTFNSFEEGEIFCKKYAKEMGFVVRRHTTRLDKKKTMTQPIENLHSKPRLSTSCEMEIQMSTIYTRAKFSVFQDELHRNLNYATNILHLDGHHRIYMVKQFCGIDKERTFEVKYRGHDESAICGYKKFECEGIPCRHILIVLRNEFLTTLPPQYILKRWTISATSDVVVDDAGVELGGKYVKKQNLTIMRMTNDFHAIVTMVKDSEELEEMGEKLLSDARKEIEEACGYSMESRTRSISLPSTIEIHPPEISKTKGSGKSLKGDKEKTIETTSKPPRLCRCCKKLTHHDSQNCPLKFR